MDCMLSSLALRKSLHRPRYWQQETTRSILRPACIPTQLFSHGGGICQQKRQHSECCGDSNHQVSSLRLSDNLLRFIEMLQGEKTVSKVVIGANVVSARCCVSPNISLAFSDVPLSCTQRPSSLLPVVFRIAVDLLFVGLSRFVQFSGDILIEESSDLKPLPFACMLTQLKCLGVVFAGTFKLAEVE